MVAQRLCTQVAGSSPASPEEASSSFAHPLPTRTVMESQRDSTGGAGA